MALVVRPLASSSSHSTWEAWEDDGGEGAEGRGLASSVLHANKPRRLKQVALVIPP